MSVELGFWIPIVSGIPDFLSCIPDSKTQDSAFHEQKFRDSGIRIPIHGEMSLFFFLTLNVLNPMFSSFTKLVSITDSHNEDEPTLASFLTSLDTHMRTHPLCKPCSAVQGVKNCTSMLVPVFKEKISRKSGSLFQSSQQCSRACSYRLKHRSGML